MIAKERKNWLQIILHIFNKGELQSIVLDCQSAYIRHEQRHAQISIIEKITLHIFRISIIEKITLDIFKTSIIEDITLDIFRISIIEKITFDIGYNT